LQFSVAYTFVALLTFADHVPWEFKKLIQGPTKLPAFYPAKDFSIYKDILFFEAGKPIKFPSSLMISENYFHRVWCLTAHRRLKNVIVIMEWIPSAAQLRTVIPPDIEPGFNRAVTSDQEKRLQRAFEMFNSSRTGSFTISELRDVLKAVDADVEDKQELQVSAFRDNMMLLPSHNRLQLALSTMRTAIHKLILFVYLMYRVPWSSCAIALRDCCPTASGGI